MTKTKLIKSASGMEVEKDGKRYPVRSEDEEGFRELSKKNYLNIEGCLHPTWHSDIKKGIEIDSERVGFEEVDVPIKYTNGEYSRTIQMVKHAILLPLKESLSFPEMNKKDSEQHDHYMNHCQVCGKHKHATLLTEDKEGEGQWDAVEFAEWVRDGYRWFGVQGWCSNFNDGSHGKAHITSTFYTTQELYKLFKK